MRASGRRLARLSRSRRCRTSPAGSRRRPPRAPFDSTRPQLGRWDSGLVTRLIDIYRDAQAQPITFDDSGLPDGARRLIALAFAVKPREGAARTQATTPFLQTGRRKRAGAVAQRGRLRHVHRRSDAVGGTIRDRPREIPEVRRAAAHRRGRRQRAADRQPHQRADRHDLRVRRRHAVARSSAPASTRRTWWRWR